MPGSGYWDSGEVYSDASAAVGDVTKLDAFAVSREDFESARSALVDLEGAVAPYGLNYNCRDFVDDMFETLRTILPSARDLSGAAKLPKCDRE